MQIALLCLNYEKGHGVAVVVRQQAKQLASLGHSVFILTDRNDHHYNDDHITVIEVYPQKTILQFLLSSISAEVVIGHTDPYFSFLPNWKRLFVTVVWEHGQPPAEMFSGNEMEWRKNLISYKKENVYPYVHKNIAISESINDELTLPNSSVIYNGLDHLSTVEKNTEVCNQEKLILLKVSRLGKEEAYYKGLDEYASLISSLKENGIDVEGCLVGKGTPEDEMLWNEKGLSVFLNVSDNELTQLYQNCHAVVSLSKWEGFNLPLAEGQFYGKPALALDIGPHREVTDYVFKNLDALALFVSQNITSFKNGNLEPGNALKGKTWKTHRDNLESLLFELNVPKKQNKKRYGFTTMVVLHYSLLRVRNLYRRLRY